MLTIQRARPATAVDDDGGNETIRSIQIRSVALTGLMLYSGVTAK